MSESIEHGPKRVRVIESPEHPVAGPTLKERVRSLRLPDTTHRERGSPKSLLAILVIACAGLAAGLVFVGNEYLRTKQQLAELTSGSTLAGVDQPGRNGAPDSSIGSDVPPSRGDQSVASAGDVVLERKGYIIPAHQILISPKVSGMIQALFIEEGQRVPKGFILAQLETTDYDADYKHAVGAFDGSWQRFLELYSGSRPQEIKLAKAKLDEIVAQKEQLYLDYKRNTRLTTSSAGAARDFELASSAYHAMERRAEQMRLDYQLLVEGPRVEKVEAAWADVIQADADMAKAKWRLDNCSIRAPISGTILSKRAELGNLVNPIAMQGSTSLCEMADLADLEVDLNIEERDVSRIFKGQICKVRAEAFPNRVYDGVVSRLMPQADRSKSAIPVRVKLTVPKEEEGVYLRPEMGAVVSFHKR